LLPIDARRHRARQLQSSFRATRMPAPMCRAQAHCPDDRRGFGCCALLRAPFGGALGRFRACSGLFFGRVMLPDECAGDLRFKNREAAFQFGAHFHCAVAVHLVGVNGRASRHVDNAERARLGCLVDRRMNFVHRGLSVPARRSSIWIPA